MYDIPLFPHCLEKWDLQTRTAILAYSLTHFPTLARLGYCFLAVLVELIFKEA